MSKATEQIEHSDPDRESAICPVSAPSTACELPEPQLRKQQMLSGMGTEEETATHAQTGTSAKRPLPRQSVSAQHLSICYGCGTRCLGAGVCHNIFLRGFPSDTPRLSETRQPFEMTASSEQEGGKP